MISSGVTGEVAGEVLVAGAVLAGFAPFGNALIRYLSVSLESLIVGGSVLLFLVALDILRGTQSMVHTSEEVSVAPVPLGTPFLAGPGAIVATIVHFLTRIKGLLLTAIAVQLVADAIRRWIQGGPG